MTSTFCGATYLPPEVLIRSFLRSVTLQVAVDELADVAGVQPAVRGQHLGGGLGVVVIAAHDAAAAQQDLAVLGDPELGAGQRRTDGADPDVARAG